MVDSEEEDTVEILNYANVRVSLTKEEFKFLVIESGKRKIALNKVVRFVLVGTKLIESQLCIISDNIYANANKTFWRAVSQRIAYVDEEGVETINKRRLDGFSALFMEKDLIAKIANNPNISKYRCIKPDEIYEYVKKEIQPLLYGFLDEFTSIETQIMDYYYTQKEQAKKTLQDVKNDIVRIDDSGDETLRSIRSYEESRLNKIESEAESIDVILKNIEETVDEICTDLGEKIVFGKKICRYVLDDVFETIFRCKDFSDFLKNKLRSRLSSFEYDNIDLVDAYYNQGTKAKYEAIEINASEWEKAKMLINILDPDQIPENYLRQYIKALGKRCISGKELYAKSIIVPEKQKKELLQKSLERGYEKAGSKLLEMYEKLNVERVSGFSLTDMVLREKSRRDRLRK